MRHCVAQQSIYDALNTKLFGYELLSRWITDLGVIREPNYLSNINWCDIDLNVASWLCSRSFGENEKRLVYFINASNELLASDNGFKQWLEILKKLQGSGIKCAVEITEDISDCILDQRYLDIVSVTSYISLDDFGYKYSTLNRLNLYDWDFCKFNINDLDRHEVSLAIDFCKNQNIKMVSEHVEGVHQLRSSLHEGLALQQGFLWHRPEVLDLSQTTLIRKESVL